MAWWRSRKLPEIRFRARLRQYPLRRHRCGPGGAAGWRHRAERNPIGGCGGVRRDRVSGSATAFLRAWIGSPGHVGRALVRDGGLAGWGVIRPCRKGRKIGPLVADDRAAAEVVLSALLASVGGGEIFLDVPGINREAVALAQDLGLRRCSRRRVCILARSRRCGWSGYSASPALSWDSNAQPAEALSPLTLLNAPRRRWAFR